MAKGDIQSDSDVFVGRKNTANAKPKEATPNGNFEYGVIESKGETISGGASGLVERLPSGDVVKSPWPGARAADCRRDLMTEGKIYEKLGLHPRLVKVINWDPEECVLTMEYMSNGCLKDYLHTHNDHISTRQRLRWAREAAEGLQLLHSASVIHCDVEPKNFLLDTDLSLKIADFSGSSLEGSQASACPGTRFIPPDFDFCRTPTVQQDLFSLGSTIYSIMTGRYPFQELPSNRVMELYKAHQFPDLNGILCGEVIERCWRYKVHSAQEIYNFIMEKEMTNFLYSQSGNLQSPTAAPGILKKSLLLDPSNNHDLLERTVRSSSAENNPRLCGLGIACGFLFDPTVPPSGSGILHPYFGPADISSGRLKLCYTYQDSH